LTWAGEGQAFLVASVQSPIGAVQAAWDSYARIAETLREHNLETVHERIFGSLSAEPSVMAARHRALQTHGFAPDNPVTYVEGVPPWGEGLAGVIIQAASTGSVDDVWTIKEGKEPCGRGWRRNGLTYLVLQNIQAFGNDSAAIIDEDTSKTTQMSFPQSRMLSGVGNPSVKEERFQTSRNDKKTSGCSVVNDLPGLSKPTQTRLMFDRAERILRDNGASYKNVARTWLSLSGILDWYPEFNKARSEKYGEFGIMPGPGDTSLLLPASTGIGADMPSGAAASMDLLAVVETDDILSPVIKLSNRKQLDAFRYGAAFSRGAVIREDDVNIIQISGTAAIDEHGVSLYPGDIRAQINCTFDKIDSLLKQEGAGLADICAATVFVKRPEYAEVFWKMAADRGLADFPAVCVVADVCREELLFEIDAEAVVGRKGFKGSSGQVAQGKKRSRT
jgi:enamine deaminase RidA (YjgF/YER057c/UK114 family)